jgi:hypothetical protein
MLDVVRLSPLFVIGRPSLYENLSRADRVLVLKRMDRHKFALFTMILAAFKTIMTISFYEHPDELRAVGYPGEERHRYKRLLPRVEERP